MRLFRFMIPLLAIAFLIPEINAEEQKAKENEGTPITLPIVVRKEKKPPTKYAPSRNIDILATIDNGAISFVLPFEDYPIYVEIEGDGTTFGYWTTTFTDAASCEMPFDGTVGDYRLTLTTADNSTYTGYFTLE